MVNSLTGESIAASLSLLRPGGHFLELGKTDLWDQKRVDEFRPGVTFHAIALDRMMAEQPELVEQLMDEVLPQFVQHNLEPLPLRTFGVRRVVDALRHMARAEHIGKVVIQAAAEKDPAQRGLRAPRRRHVSGHRRPGRLGPESGPLAGRSRCPACLVLLGRSGVSDEVAAAARSAARGRRSRRGSQVRRRRSRGQLPPCLRGSPGSCRRYVAFSTWPACWTTASSATRTASGSTG